MKKNTNKRIIFDYIRENKFATRQDLQFNLGFSLPTIHLYINELLDEKLIIESGIEKNTGGRNSKRYSLNADFKFAIGIDITQNHITVVLIDLLGKIMDIIRIREKFVQSDAYSQILGKLTKEIIDKNNLTPSQVLGCGLGMPALINEENNKIIYGEILKLKQFDLETFAKYIPVPTLLYNDANAAGYAETFTNFPNSATFYLMLSNNVGGSVLINGEVYTGNTLKSGEVGHITLYPDGKQCYCGLKGCTDPYLSATVLSNLTEGNLQQFFEELSESQEFQKIWHEYCHDLVLTIHNLRMLFDSDIILGGYVGAYIEPYIEDINKELEQYNTFADEIDFVKPCAYKEEAIGTGAALPFVNNFLDEVY